MIEKFKIAQHDRSDRNVKASVEQIKQQTYINNMENKTKINEIIDELGTTETDITNLTSTVTTNSDNITTLQGQMTAVEGDIEDLQDINEYSTSEQVIGKWINGKPLYRKVIDFGYLPNATSKSVSTDLDIATTTIVKASGTATGTSGGDYFCITLPDTNTTTLGNSTRLTFNTSSSKYQAVATTGIDRSNYYAYIIIEYIKTTD